MQVQSVKNEYNPNFGIRISLESVRKANQACIECGKLARLEGLSFEKYNALHREDFIHRIGDKTYDFYVIAKEIVSNKEKLNEAFGKAWNKVIGKNS